MASSISAPAFGPQDAQPTHAEKSDSEIANQQKPCLQSSVTKKGPNNTAAEVVPRQIEPKVSSVSKDAIPKSQTADASYAKVNAAVVSSVTSDSENVDVIQPQASPLINAAKTPAENASGETVSTNQRSSNSVEKTLSSSATSADKPSAVSTSDSKKTEKAAEDSNPTDKPSAVSTSDSKMTEKAAEDSNPTDKPSAVSTSDSKKTEKAAEDSNPTDKPSAVSTSDSKKTEKAAEDSNPTDNALKPLSKLEPSSTIDSNSGQAKSSPEPLEVIGTSACPDTSVNCHLETAPAETVPNKNSKNSRANNNKPQLEDGEEPVEKKAKLVHISNSFKEGGKSPEQILELMDRTFEQRRKVVTKQMPTIPELKEMYPDLFTGKQLLLEFQRITKIDIDQKIQEFCVRHATAVIELARHEKEAAPVLARWEQAKQENDTLRQYWDMVTALCLLPLHFGENFVEMVLEIGEDEEVIAQGKIVPTLVARGNIFRTDEFFLIAENTIVQEFEEFTIAFASLYSSYWVFNMEYPQTIENTYNYIQRCIVRQREPGAIPIACKNLTKTLLKWNKGKEGK